MGRICDHLDSTSTFVIRNLGLIVLDEADRLLDMGFERKLKWIVNKLKELKGAEAVDSNLSNTEVDGMENEEGEESRNIKSPANTKAVVSSNKEKPFQTVLVSATLSVAVRQLADFVLAGDAAWVSVDNKGVLMNLNDDGKKASNDGVLLSDDEVVPIREYKQNNSHSNIDDAGNYCSDSEKPATFPDKSGGVRCSRGENALTIPKNLKQYFVEISLKTRFVTLMSTILDKVKHGKVRLCVSVLVVCVGLEREGRTGGPGFRVEGLGLGFGV